jgi:hypothetical protein
LGSIVTLPKGFFTVMIPDVCIHRGKLIFDSLCGLLSVCRRMENDSSDVDGKTAVFFIDCFCPARILGGLGSTHEIHGYLFFNDVGCWESERSMVVPCLFYCLYLLDSS